MQNKADGIPQEAQGAAHLTALWQQLPWVNQLKHLGNTISNIIDGCQLDMKVKNGKYIDKNNSLCEEFYYAHPKVKTKLEYTILTLMGPSYGN